MEDKMKHYVPGLMIVAIFTLLQSAAFAQITLNASDLPNLFGAGVSEQTYSNFDSLETMNVGIPSSSAAQSWTLPTFVVLDSSRVDGVLPSSTPYAADFPTATYAETASQTDTGVTFQYFSYLELSSNTLSLIGTAIHVYGSSGGHSIDSTIVQYGSRSLLQLPIGLGDVVAGTPDTSTYGPGMMEVSTTSDNYDAYGSITLANGTFQALRSYQVTTTQEYVSGALAYASKSYSLVWITREGHQLSVGVDSGATSGTVGLRSISVTYAGPTPTLVKRTDELPDQFSLQQNYPNPFNPTTNIGYQLKANSFVTLKVYDVLGREVATLVNGDQSSGSHSVIFDGSRLSSGVYLYRIDALGGNGQRFSAMKKLVLMK
jgi:hypothetical protein